MTEDSNKDQNSIVVFAQNEADGEMLEWLKKQFDVIMTDETPDIKNTDLRLHLNSNGLVLVGNGRMLMGDFTKMLMRIRPNNLNSEMLVKASKIKGIDGALTVIDATAGLGEDAFLLAAAGFYVKLYERDMVIASLLKDALKRAAKVPKLAEVVGRMQLFAEDSVKALKSMAIPADVVLLDPMFPERQKSALIKKKFQLLQQLERPCSDEEELMNAALASKPRKIVIKRPANGTFLANRKPDYSIKGKSIRYDCIVLHRDTV